MCLFMPSSCDRHSGSLQSNTEDWKEIFHKCEQSHKPDCQSHDRLEEFKPYRALC
jgi:hypothetical protein